MNVLASGRVWLHACHDDRVECQRGDSHLSSKINVDSNADASIIWSISTFSLHHRIVDLLVHSREIEYNMKETEA